MVLALIRADYEAMVTSTSTPGSREIEVYTQSRHQPAWNDKIFKRRETHNLLDDLAGRVQVNQPLVNLELVTVPGFGTLTARLEKRSNILETKKCLY